MISFRYHVVSLVAVFLALALGIVVGTTALNGPITDDLRQRVDAANTTRQQLQQQLDTARTQNSDADAFVNQFGSRVVAGALDGQQVLLVVLPGGNGVVGGVSDEIAAAGGTVSGTVTMSADFFSTARAADIKGLVTNGTQPTGLEYPTTDDAVALGGTLLAYVLTGEGSSTDLTQTLSAFTSLQVLAADGAAQVKPSKKIVVVGSGAGSDAETGKAYATFVTTFQQQKSTTVVVAGDNASDTSNGVIAAVRADDTLTQTVSTVDNADTAMGRISTVLALGENAQVGAYGTGANADSPYPELTS